MPCSTMPQPLAPAFCFFCRMAHQGASGLSLPRLGPRGEADWLPSPSSPYVMTTLNYPEPPVITQRKQDAKKDGRPTRTGPGRLLYAPIPRRLHDPRVSSRASRASGEGPARDLEPPPLVFARAIRFHSRAVESSRYSMRLSRFFLPILRENPKEADIVSHRLMLRAGMLRQEAAGMYAFLPLGFRVLKKIEQIVREEQDRAGAIELLMPTLQLADLWRESGRYDAYGPEMLRIKDRHERELLYGPTNEEMITEIFRAYVRSYRELPKILYHIQWKFRDEQRPRFGLMRGREFLMKDAYSFDLDEPAARLSYNRMFVAYLRTFARMGLKAIPMRAETGPIGGDLSHEFIILAQTGESAVYCDKDILDLPIPGADVDYDGDLAPIIRQWTSLYAATADVHDAARFEREVPADRRLNTRGIEVGQIFYFGTKYSVPMKTVVS